MTKIYRSDVSMPGLNLRSIAEDPRAGIRLASAFAVALVVGTLWIAMAKINPAGRPIVSYQAGVVAGVVAVGWSLWAAVRSRGLEGRWRIALIFLLAGSFCMLGSLVGMLALGYNATNPKIDIAIQTAGIFTYLTCAGALFALPAKRMLARRKLPWVLDVALIVTAISAAGWFFLIAPQVNFTTTNFAFWLTFAYPLANLLTIASIVAAISLGGPFLSARGLLMLGMILNVTGDVIQAIHIQRQIPSPSAYTHVLWIASALLVGIAALQIRFDSQTPTRVEVESTTSKLSPARAVVPIIFLTGLVVLALWGNSVRPNSNDVIGLNFGCMFAIACCLGRIMCLIQDNSELGQSLAAANENLDLQVQERTRQLHDAMDDLERQKAFLRSVIDAMPSFVVSKSAEGQVLLANQAAAKLFGKPRAEFEGSNYRDVVAPFNPDAPGIIEAEARTLLTGGRSISIERTVVGADGQERMFEVVKMPVQGKTGVPEQVLIVGNDITVRKEAEKTLIAARDAAEEAAKVKSRFLANMSHEIRTPMNGVLGLAEVLLEEDLPPRHRKIVQNIRLSGESLLGLVNDVLALAELDSGDAEVAAAPTSLSQLLGEVVETHRPSAAAKGLRLRCDAHLDPDALYLADSTRIRQILTHLLSNAIKFTPSGSVTVEAEQVRQSQDIATIRITVEDTGIGIPDHRLQSIFEPFSQVDTSSTRSFGGAGLGLSLCRQSAVLMGGSMTVDSEEGKGSRFIVEFPLQKLAEEETTPVEREAPLTGLEVLVVEDNQVNQMILQQILSRLGCSVQVAGNGLEAVQWLESHPCQLVLMDCQMPVMDGLEATRRIRQLTSPVSEVPIVAVTANAMAGDRERCLAAGMDDYVAKPIRIDALTAALGRVSVTRYAA